MPATAMVFEPALYSIAENRFLMDWAGKPPVVAFHKATPTGVNPAAVRPILTSIYELVELQAHQGVAWAGPDAIRDSIVRYLSWQERTLEIQRRGGPRHASMFGWGEKGQTYKYAMGSDSGAVTCEINEAGDYIPFRVNLLAPNGESGPSVAEVAPWLKQVDFGGPAKLDEITETRDEKSNLGNLQCSVCGKSLEFKVNSRNSYTMCRAAMAKHLKSAKTSIDRHLRLMHRIYK